MRTVNVNKAKLDNLQHRLSDVAKALGKLEEEIPFVTESEAKRIFQHAAEFGTRGFSKLQIIGAWKALRLTDGS